MRRIFISIILTVILVVLFAFSLILLAAGFVDGLLLVSHILGFQHTLGIDTQASKNYDSVSGYLPVIVSALGFSGLLVTAWHHLNCESPGCPRIASHHYIDKDGKKHILCHVHDIDPHPKDHWWSKRRGHSLEEIHSRIINSKIS